MAEEIKAAKATKAAKGDSEQKTEGVAKAKATAPDSVKPSGQFQVLQFGDQVRMYSPEGQAVSPAHGATEVSEDTLGANGKPTTHLNLLSKKAARFNIQMKQNQAAPKKPKKNLLAEEAAKQAAEEAEASAGGEA